MLGGCTLVPVRQRTEQKTVDGMTITLTRPETIEVLRDQALVVTLADAAGRPVDGAQVYFDLTMPAMEMGTNQPIADPSGNGRYQATSVFTMDGDWRIVVHATVADQTYIAAFDQVVKPQ
jgi:nitrogen fixation protein FixH